MAKMVLQNGTITVDLTADERETYDGLPAGKVDAYLTLWLEEQKRQLVNERFNALSTEEKADVLALLKKQGRGGGRP